MRIELPNTTVTKVKDFRGRVTGYRATCGLFEACGFTAAEAKLKLGERLAKSAAELTSPTVFAIPGGVMIAYPSYNGEWSYGFYRPAGDESRPHLMREGGVCLAFHGRDDVRERMRRHYFGVYVEPFVRLLEALGNLPESRCTTCDEKLTDLGAHGIGCADCAEHEEIENGLGPGWIRH